MLKDSLEKLISSKIKEKQTNGSYKAEKSIISPQSNIIKLNNIKNPVLNFCSNNYLGLSNHPQVKKAAEKAITEKGFGMSSVRFICGTQDIHKELEKSVSKFLSTEDTILFSSCFDANSGLFENLLSENDCIISASLNHASIIDGIRLCKAKKLIYEHNNIKDLESKLKESKNSNIVLVVTDGVFSMEGEFAPLDKIVDLCEKYQALLIVDDSHATGFIGENGKGCGELYKVQENIDLFTGTFGKALGGASGGYISGKKELIDWFRNTSRPYLFSNSLAPAIVGGTLKSLEIVQSQEGKKLRENLKNNTTYFRKEMKNKGFNINNSEHPIIAIMLKEAKLASKIASELLNHKIYVIGFSFPVVPKNKARIRVQISATHSKEEINLAINHFNKLIKKYGGLQWLK